jgi:hypothetical protein
MDDNEGDHVAHANIHRFGALAIGAGAHYALYSASVVPERVSLAVVINSHATPAPWECYTRPHWGLSLLAATIPEMAEIVVRQRVQGLFRDVPGKALVAHFNATADREVCWCESSWSGWATESLPHSFGRRNGCRSGR